MRRLGMVPRVALLSYSNFGSSNSESAQKMRAALAIIQEHVPELEVAGEMHGDAALDYGLLKKKDAGFEVERQCQPAGFAQHRCRQYCLQPAQDRGGLWYRDRSRDIRLRRRCTSSLYPSQCAVSST